MHWTFGRTAITCLAHNGDTLATSLKFADGKDPTGGSWMASSGLGNTVTLYANFYGDAANGQYRSATAQAETLIHELFHKKFRLIRTDHVDFLTKFHIPRAQGQSTGAAIDEWIGRDCK
jgi:hypothetical protein